MWKYGILSWRSNSKDLLNSLVIRPYLSSLSSSPLDGTWSQYSIDKYKFFLLVEQHWCVYLNKSIKERSLLVRSYFNISSQNVLFMFCKMGNNWQNNCCFAESFFIELVLKNHEASLWSCHQAVSLYVSLNTSGATP